MGTRGEDDNDGDYEGMIRRALADADGVGALDAAFAAVIAALERLAATNPEAAEMLACRLGEAMHRQAQSLSREDGRPESLGRQEQPSPDEVLLIFDATLAALAGGDPLADLESGERGNGGE